MGSLLKKIGSILLKVILGIFVFYLFLAFVFIPAGVPWLIKSQVTKLLNHQVSVRSVWFNPFLLKVSVNGFKIMDADKKLMVGFDKFWLDASFLSLFKKVYRVESTGINGLTVNVALLPGNRINLMELIPKDLQQAAKTDVRQSAAEKPKSAKVELGGQKAAAAAPLPQPIPRVIVDLISLKQGRVSLVDQTLTPNFSTSLSAIDISVTKFSTDPGSQTKVSIQAKLDEKGKISAEALLKPFMQPIEMESTFSLNDYALQVLTPYVGKYAGRSVKDGKLDIKMDYRISGNKINARHKVLVQRFDFGKKVESKDALPLPFGLAVALLEDPQGRIAISLPVKGDMSQPEFQYLHLLGQVIKNFFLKLVTSPLMSLVSMMGQESSTEELGYVSFEPGKSELTEPAQEKLKVIVQALKQRPKISLEINGSYDPEVDWKTIKTEAFENRFKAARQESVKSDFRLLEDMFKVRFGVHTYWRLARDYKSKGKTEDELKTEMKGLIIKEGLPDKVALEQLAQVRAKSVYDFIITNGFESSRVSIGPSRQTQSSVGQIPLEFTLTVFGDPAAAESRPSNS
jgi:outer membrane protein OmpA-like peptidoglycan-associated protein